MPEGHTLHKAAQVQRPWFEGALVRASSPQGRFAEAPDLDGARLVEIEAIGKHLFYRFESGRRTLRLHVHLGLAGRFRVRVDHHGGARAEGEARGGPARKGSLRAAGGQARGLEPGPRPGRRCARA